jgi:hypothetical protein
MNCRQLQESLGDHSVGLLEGATLSDFERHLSACAECAKSARQFHRCMELLNHAAPPRPPDDLWFGVRARLELERAVISHVRESRHVSTRRPWHSNLVATAAGFAVAAVVMIGLSAQRPASWSDDLSASEPATELQWLDQGARVRSVNNTDWETFAYSGYRDLYMPRQIPAIEGLPRAHRLPHFRAPRLSYPYPPAMQAFPAGQPPPKQEAHPIPGE